MKKFRFIPLLFAVLVSFAVQAQVEEEIQDDCNSSETKKTCKKLLEPYSYDASKATRVTFKNKPQLKELEIPLYMGEQYRFVFSREGMPQNVDISIWDHKYEAKHRTQLFSSKDYPADQVEYVWEPDKSRKMYINYEIPPTSDVEKKGCIVMILGYKVKGQE